MLFRRSAGRVIIVTVLLPDQILLMESLGIYALLEDTAVSRDNIFLFLLHVIFQQQLKTHLFTLAFPTT